MNEQIVDAIFTRFDMILNVNNEKRENFDEIICFDVATEITNKINEFRVVFEDVTNSNIENFVVEIVEINFEIVDKIVEFLFSFLLKFRFETLIIFFA